MTLRMGFELRDFDLERVGFSVSVLDETKKRQLSEGYLRMSLEELGAFLKALKAAPQDIELVMVDGAREMAPVNSPPTLPKAVLLEPEIQQDRPPQIESAPQPRPRR